MAYGSRLILALQYRMLVDDILLVLSDHAVNDLKVSREAALNAWKKYRKEAAKDEQEDATRFEEIQKRAAARADLEHKWANKDNTRETFTVLHAEYDAQKPLIDVITRYPNDNYRIRGKYRKQWPSSSDQLPFSQVQPQE